MRSSTLEHAGSNDFKADVGIPVQRDIDRVSSTSFQGICSVQQRTQLMLEQGALQGSNRV